MAHVRRDNVRSRRTDQLRAQARTGVTDSQRAAVAGPDSPTGDPTKLSEMFGYAESTPIMITQTVVETN